MTEDGSPLSDEIADSWLGVAPAFALSRGSGDSSSSPHDPRDAGNKLRRRHGSSDLVRGAVFGNPAAPLRLRLPQAPMPLSER